MRHQVIDNPASRERITFLLTGRETHGELLRFAWVAYPGGGVPAENLHPRQEERYEVLRGRMGARVGGKKCLLQPGDRLAIPPGTRHVLWNAGDEELQVMVEFRPALRMQTVLETVFGLARDGQTNARGIPPPLQTAVLFTEFTESIQIPRPLGGVLKPLLGLVSPLARRLGYRAQYERYSGGEEPWTSAALS